MELNIRIDLSSPRWLRRALLLGVPIAMMAVTSVAIGVPKKFMIGDTLKAADLNANFDDVEARLVALEGEAPNVDTGSTNAQFLTTSQTFVDVAGLDAVVTTSGRPVLVTVNTNLNVQNGTAPPAYSRWGVVTVTRDGVNLGHSAYGYQIVSALNQDNIPVAIAIVDNPPAGAHTYRVQVRNGQGGYEILMGEGGVTQAISAVEL